MKKLLAFTLITLTLVTQAEVQCIAHRGLHSEMAMPNSLDAIKAAYDAKVEGIEFDIRHTKDGYGLLAHNPELSEFIDKGEGKHCDHEKLIADATAEEIRSNCKQSNGREVQFFSEVVRYFEKENNGTYPYLLVELKDEKVSAKTIQNLVRLTDIYSVDKLRFISFESTVINQLAANEQLRDIGRFWITVLPVKQYKKRKQAKVAADGILFSSRGYAGKLTELAIPMPTAPTITDHLWRKNYVEKMRKAGLETAVWLNWSGKAFPVIYKRGEKGLFTHHVDYTNIDMCRYLKRGVDMIVADDPHYCMALRENLPEKCKSLGFGFSKREKKH